MATPCPSTHHALHSPLIAPYRCTIDRQPRQAAHGLYMDSYIFKTLSEIKTNNTTRCVMAFRSRLLTTYRNSIMLYRSPSIGMSFQPPGQNGVSEQLPAFIRDPTRVIISPNFLRLSASLSQQDHAPLCLCSPLYCVPCRRSCQQSGLIRYRYRYQPGIPLLLVKT